MVLEEFPIQMVTSSRLNVSCHSCTMDWHKMPQAFCNTSNWQSIFYISLIMLFHFLEFLVTFIMNELNSVWTCWHVDCTIGVIGVAYRIFSSDAPVPYTRPTVLILGKETLKMNKMLSFALSGCLYHESVRGAGEEPAFPWDSVKTFNRCFFSADYQVSHFDLRTPQLDVGTYVYWL